MMRGITCLLAATAVAGCNCGGRLMPVPSSEGDASADANVPDGGSTTPDS
jgi:hypothetical protein